MSKAEKIAVSILASFAVLMFHIYPRPTVLTLIAGAVIWAIVVLLESILE